MGMRLVAPLALMMLAPAMAMAGGRAASECMGGSAAVDGCTGGGDPLSALEGGALSAHGDKKDAKPGEGSALAAMTPTRHPVPAMALPRQDAREELPASYNAPTVFGMPAPPPPPASWPGGGGGSSGGGGAQAPGSGLWPTPPTAPTLPSVVGPNVPAWNFGTQ